MSYGILSGLEIAEAVERQNQYARVQRYLTEEPSTVVRLHKRQLAVSMEDLPRIHISNFSATASSAGGALNPNSYNLKLHPELLVYTGQELDSRKDNPTQKLVIPDSGLLLTPGELYLARTVEYTETYNLVPVIDGRSSTGRLGLAAHVTAGYGDNGFKGTWTLELFVVRPLRIYPDTAIAQIRYHTLAPGADTYKGKYNNTVDEPAIASRLFRENPIKSEL